MKLYRTARQQTDWSSPELTFRFIDTIFEK